MKRYKFYRRQVVKLKGLDQQDNHPYMIVVGFTWATEDDGTLKTDNQGRNVLGGVRTGWFTDNKTWIEKEWHSNSLEPVEKSTKTILEEAYQFALKEKNTNLAEKIKQLYNAEV